MFLINFPIDAAKLLFFFDMRKKIVLNYTKSRSFQFFNVCLSYIYYFSWTFVDVLLRLPICQ